MSDGSLDGTADAPPSKKPTPWSVRKIVEQVTGRPMESMQDPPGTRRAPRAPPPLERYHEEPEGPQVALLVAPEEASRHEERTAVPSRFNPELSTVSEGPSLKAFLPGELPSSGARTSARSSSLPLTHPLPREVVEEVDRLRAEDGDVPFAAGDATHAHKRSELERIYLSYLLMHLDKLTEPALKYLRHAVEEECEERGLVR